jgi:hypothetical protein
MASGTMIRPTWFSVALLVLVPPLGCTHSQYRVERPQLDCEDANAQAHRALVTRDYEITRFNLATPSSAGFIEAKRQTPDGLRHGRLRIVCDHSVLFQPVEGSWFLPNFEFSREVYYALVALGGASGAAGAGSGAATPTAPAAASDSAGQPGGSAAGESGLHVIVRPLDRFEIRKDLGVDLERRGLVVIRVEIDNHTTRTYQMPAGAIALVDESGNRMTPLGREEIGRILRQSAAAAPGPDEEPLPPLDVGAATAALDAKALRYGRVAAGASVDGCLYFRAAAYRSARLSLIDTETGEKEGMVVGF